MARKNRLISKIANSVTEDGTFSNEVLAADFSVRVDVYDSINALPIPVPELGTQAFVPSAKRFYLSDGTGWYSVSAVNSTPIIQSITDSDGNLGPFTLATDGSNTVLTITALDSDADPLTYSATPNSGFNGLATISQASNVFTITPYSIDSATTTEGAVTFTLTDDVNVATSIQSFTLNFIPTPSTSSFNNVFLQTINSFATDISPDGNHIIQNEAYGSSSTPSGDVRYRSHSNGWDFSSLSQINGGSLMGNISPYMFGLQFIDNGNAVVSTNVSTDAGFFRQLTTPYDPSSYTATGAFSIDDGAGDNTCWTWANINGANYYLALTQNKAIKFFPAAAMSGDGTTLNWSGSQNGGDTSIDGGNFSVSYQANLQNVAGSQSVPQATWMMKVIGNRIFVGDGTATIWWYDMDGYDISTFNAIGAGTNLPATGTLDVSGTYGGQTVPFNDTGARISAFGFSGGYDKFWFKDASTDNIYIFDL